MRKKVILFAALALVLTGCKTELSNKGNNPTKLSNTIGFQVGTENTTRATALNVAGHYNFGVFAYKSTDKVNNIMANYLVGYNDNTNGYSKPAVSTTWGDAAGNLDGLSYWMYEGMGSAEYNGTYAGETVNPGTKFASNVANQYLRYWDNAAEYTCFYAYAPYVNNTATGKTVTYVDGQAVGSSSETYMMTIPDGTIKHGYDKADEFEFMYAWTKVAKANYGHDVALNFKRLNAKVNIKFWEDIPGYSVRIIDLTPTYSISAVPAIKDGTSNNYGYKLGEIYSENGAKIQFAPTATTPTATVSQLNGTKVSTPITFAAPTAAKIGESRIDATESTTTYYAIPKNGAATGSDLAKTGLTFHVSYELISTTGEVITVKDATVFVPETYVNWDANTKYTYIFKITKNSNGSTEANPTIDPTDPEVPTELSLYPIVFDNCTVEEWKTQETEHIITEGTALAYHNVTLSTYSLVSGDINITIEDADQYKSHAINMNNVAVTDPSGTVVAATVYTPGESTIHVPAGATPGVYTVTYTCPSSDVYTNHPKTWTAQFVVGNAYAVSTRLDEVGTNGDAATKLTILTSINNATAAQPTATTGLSIMYPDNAVDNKVKVELGTDGKAYVTVAQNATPGKYKLIYTNNYAVDGSNVVPVKVAEKVFEVKDYTFTLNTYKVLNGTSVTVTASAAPTNGVYTATGFTVTGNSIAVPNNTTEGDYTVTLTVNGGTAEEVVYTKQFNVANQYSVTLSKNTLNTTVGAAGSAEYGTDFITVTSTKNQVADAVSTELAAKYTVATLAAADYQFVVDGSDIKLQVKKSVAAGNYKVVYTGQTGKTAEAEFVIQK